MKALKIIFALLLSVNLQAGEGVPFPLNTNCVAWKAKKVMFLVATKWPIGMNCKVTLLDVSEESYRRFVLQVPLSSFDSGEKDRDLVVARELGAPEHQELILDSGEIPTAIFTEILSGSKKEMEASMVLMSVRYKLPLELTVLEGQDGQAKVLRGQFLGKLSDFGIHLPKIAGGLVANPKDYIELHFQLNLP